MISRQRLRLLDHNAGLIRNMNRQRSRYKARNAKMVIQKYLNLPNLLLFFFYFCVIPLRRAIYIFTLQLWFPCKHFSGATCCHRPAVIISPINHVWSQIEMSGYELCGITGDTMNGIVTYTLQVHVWKGFWKWLRVSLDFSCNMTGGTVNKNALSATDVLDVRDVSVPEGQSVWGWVRNDSGSCSLPPAPPRHQVGLYLFCKHWII